MKANRLLRLACVMLLVGCKGDSQLLDGSVDEYEDPVVDFDRRVIHMREEQIEEGLHLLGFDDREDGMVTMDTPVTVYKKYSRYTYGDSVDSQNTPILRLNQGVSDRR